MSEHSSEQNKIETTFREIVPGFKDRVDKIPQLGLTRDIRHWFYDNQGHYPKLMKTSYDVKRLIKRGIELDIAYATKPNRNIDINNPDTEIGSDLNLTYRYMERESVGYIGYFTMLVEYDLRSGKANSVDINIHPNLDPGRPEYLDMSSEELISELATLYFDPETPKFLFDMEPDFSGYSELREEDPELTESLENLARAITARRLDYLRETYPSEDLEGFLDKLSLLVAVRCYKDSKRLKLGEEKYQDELVDSTIREILDSYHSDLEDVGEYRVRFDLKSKKIKASSTNLSFTEDLYNYLKSGRPESEDEPDWFEEKIGEELENISNEGGSGKVSADIHFGGVPFQYEYFNFLLDRRDNRIVLRMTPMTKEINKDSQSFEFDFPEQVDVAQITGALTSPTNQAWPQVLNSLGLDSFGIKK